MYDAHYFRAQATKCQKIAEHLNDPVAADNMRLAAAKHRARAADLDSNAITSRFPHTNAEKGLPRFYFYVEYRGGFYGDDIGETFATSAEALKHAKRIVEELSQGEQPARAIVHVRDKQGGLVSGPIVASG